MKATIEIDDDAMDDLFRARLRDDIALLQRSGTFLPVFSNDPIIEAVKVADMIAAYQLVLSYNEAPA